MNRRQDGLSVVQAMMLHAVLPIVMVGVVLPVGLVALFLAIDGAPVSGAVDRGELFLAGANAAFTGCLVLVASRPDKALNASILSLMASVFVVLPGYAAWAYVSVASHRDLAYSVDLVINGGLVAAVAGIVASLALVGYAFLSGPGNPSGSDPKRSAILK
jgi:hypothetical protein